MNTGKLTSREEWQSGWKLVFCSAIGFSLFSVMLATSGIFMEPLGKEFGWSRTLLSSGPSIATGTVAVLSPFFGILIDRFGTRRLALPGIVLTMASISAFSLVNGAYWQWIVLWACFGIISVTIKSTIWTTAVVGVFEKSRGLALGLTLSGTALTQILIPPLGNWLIETFGWRQSYVWLGVGWSSITFLLCWLFFFDIHDRIKADHARTGAAAAPVVDLPGLTIAQAWRDSALWRLAISNFVVMMLTIGLGIHLFPILTEAGVSRTNAAWLMSLAGVAGIAGKLITGLLLDRFRPNLVGGITLGAAAITFLLLIDGIRSPALIVFAIVVNGYAAGTKTHITGYLTSVYAGMRNFGVIYGMMSALMSAASGLGPLVAGLIYDLSGSYGPFLIAGAIGCILGGLLIMSLPRYPDWEARAKSADGSPDQAARQ